MYIYIYMCVYIRYIYIYNVIYSRRRACHDCSFKNDTGQFLWVAFRVCLCNVPTVNLMECRSHLGLTLGIHFGTHFALTSHSLRTHFALTSHSLALTSHSLALTQHSLKLVDVSLNVFFRVFIGLKIDLFVSGFQKQETCHNDARNAPEQFLN